jgi:quercetin dioxygenase-like cupin family protein
MLTNIAHTKRHFIQLKKVTQHPDFPTNDPYKTNAQKVFIKNMDFWLPIGSEPGFELLSKACRYMPLIGGTYENWQGIPHKDILFGMLELDTGGYYPGHNHPAPEIYFVLSGEAEWTVGNQTFTATPGTAIYHPTEKMHRMVNKGKDKLKVIYLWWAPNGDTSAFNGYKFLERLPGK